MYIFQFVPTIFLHKRTHSKVPIFPQQNILFFNTIVQRSSINNWPKIPFFHGILTSRGIQIKQSIKLIGTPGPWQDHQEVKKAFKSSIDHICIYIFILLSLSYIKKIVELYYGQIKTLI